MAAPDFLTWDGGTGDEGTELPRRPSTDDLGGDEKLDNDEKPPDDIEHFTAGGWNQKVKQLVALARVAAACKLEIRFDGGGVPFVNRATAAGSAVSRTTFTPTDNGNGDTTITWPANTFPPSTVSPSGLTLLWTTRALGVVEEVTNGVRVRTWELDASGNATAANIPWTLAIN